MGTTKCARRDDQILADHFQVRGKHADRTSNFERILVGLTRRGQLGVNAGAITDASDDARNLFADDVRAAQAVFEASGSGSHKWIETQRNHDDPVGNLAAGILCDRELPVGLGTKAQLESHLRPRGRHILESLEMTWTDYPGR